MGGGWKSPRFPGPPPRRGVLRPSPAGRLSSEPRLFAPDPVIDSSPWLAAATWLSVLPPPRRQARGQRWTRPPVPVAAAVPCFRRRGQWTGPKGSSLPCLPRRIVSYDDPTMEMFESRRYRAMERITNLMLLNAAWLVASLPLVTIFPATAGLFGAVRDLQRDADVGALTS